MTDEQVSLRGVSVAVITVSDRCAAGEQEDRSGPAVVEVLRRVGCVRVETMVVSDDRAGLERVLREVAGRCALVLTTGGTGLAARDTTPEATLAVCERMVPGIAEMMRAAGVKETPFAALGRGVAGVCGLCLVVNLPGSPRGAVTSLEAVLGLLPHALALLAGEAVHGERAGG